MSTTHADLLDYTAWRARAGRGETERTSFAMLNRRLRSNGEYPHWQANRIVGDLREQLWKSGANQAGLLSAIGTLDTLVAEPDRAEGVFARARADMQRAAPEPGGDGTTFVRGDALSAYADARRQSGRSSADERVAWSRVTQTLQATGAQDLPADEVVRRLQDHPPQLVGNLTPGQQRAMGNVLMELNGVSDVPERIQRVIDAQGRQQREPTREQQPEPRRSERGSSSLAAEVVRYAAPGSVMVYTWMHSGVSVTMPGGQGETPINGQNVFGERAERFGDLEQMGRNFGTETRRPEGASFTPSMEDIREPQDVVVRRHRFGKDETRRQNVKIGEQRRMVAGENGKMEPAVTFCYSFNSQGERDSGLDQMHADPASDRSGNHLVVWADLPQSVADKVQAAIERGAKRGNANEANSYEANSYDVRDAAEQLVLQRGGVDRDAWYGRGQYQDMGAMMRPPFEERAAMALPFHVLTPGPNGEMVVREVRGRQPVTSEHNLDDLVKMHTGRQGQGETGPRSGDGRRPDYQQRTHGNSRTGDPRTI